MSDGKGQRPESLLPYEQWTEEAMRHVVVQALAYTAAKGLPGEHHFYISFRTDFPGVVIPDRLRAQYPQEITIVLQHQFWDLQVDEMAKVVTVGLSFGGIPSTLRIPFAALTQFVDPHLNFGLRFTPGIPEATPDVASAAGQPISVLPAPVAPAPAVAPAPPAVAAETETDTENAEERAEPQVVSLDAFRRRTPPRES